MIEHDSNDDYMHLTTITKYDYNDDYVKTMTHYDEDGEGT